LHDKESISIKDQIATMEKEILRTAIPQFKSTRDIARHLGISQPTIVRKIKKYGLNGIRCDFESTMSFNSVK